MRYTQATFSIPVSFGKLSEEEYEYRVGKITWEAFEKRAKESKVK